MQATVFVKGSPDKDEFFTVNPEFKFIDEFKRFIKKHGEEKAGKYMWAIYMTEDPSSSLYNSPPTIRRDNVKRNFLKDEKFDWEELEEVITAYKKHGMGAKKRMYAEYLELMEERSKYLKTLSYEEADSVKEAKEIDAFIKGGHSVWEALAKIEKEYLTEAESSGRIHGDKELSAIESGAI